MLLPDEHVADRLVQLLEVLAELRREFAVEVLHRLRERLDERLGVVLRQRLRKVLERLERPLVAFLLLAVELVDGVARLEPYGLHLPDDGVFLVPNDGLRHAGDGIRDGLREHLVVFAHEFADLGEARLAFLVLAHQVFDEVFDVRLVREGALHLFRALCLLLLLLQAEGQPHAEERCEECCRHAAKEARKMRLQIVEILRLEEQEADRDAEEGAENAEARRHLWLFVIAERILCDLFLKTLLGVADVIWRIVPSEHSRKAQDRQPVLREKIHFLFPLSVRCAHHVPDGLIVIDVLFFQSDPLPRSHAP